MVLKRKRSDSELSRGSSLLSSPPNVVPHQLYQFPNNQIQTPSLFSSRTRKRYRNNRPSEDDVHQHTLSLLFSAQQSSRPQFESPVQHPPIESIPQINQSHTQQPSLHAFWQLPKGRRTSLSSITSPSFLISNSDPLPYISQTTNCEDCDASLSSDDTDAADIDIMMDVDNVGGTSYACTRCSKPVCSRCAISNLGKERKCLGCAGRGLEWMDGMDRSGLRNDFGYVITLE